jgi:hypothetical protein
MAWTSPPTFSDGSVLSASQLNILSADLEHLYGSLQGAQPAFPSHFFNQDLTSVNNGWAFRYRNRYFHYRVKVLQNTCNNLYMVVNGTSYTIDTTTRTTPYTYSGYKDVNAQGLTVGTIYSMYFTADLGSLSNAVIEYVIQAEGTSL